MLILKASAFSIVVCVLMLSLKKDQPGFAFLISLCGAMYLLTMAANQLSSVIAQLEDLASLVDAPSFGILIRVLATALAAQFASDLCRENGLASAGFCVELLGRVLAMMETLPLLQSLVQSFLSFLP